MIAHRLDVFHRRCLRTILGISWCDHATIEEVIRKTGMERLKDIVSTRRRKMAGHVLRLQRERPAHTAIWALGARRRQKKEGEAEEAMAKHYHLIQNTTTYNLLQTPTCYRFTTNMCSSVKPTTHVINTLATTIQILTHTFENVNIMLTLHGSTN